MPPENKGRGKEMGCCSSCGSPVPDGQSICSMCYGDPAYGSDGYYEEWLRERDHDYEPEEAISANMDDPDIPF
jgi:hypothetical protein